ncbi:MAG: aspartate--tRNA(Asn) ligase, partial [Candidatus Thermoplasmatota archaeon]
MNLRMRKYSNEIKKEDYGKEIVVGGWIQEIRTFGSLAFIILRDREGEVQITAFKKDEEVFKKIVSLPRESVIAAICEVRENKQVKKNFELIPKEVKVLGIAKAPLPMGVIDKVGVDLDTRLDARFIDLRREETKKIFKIGASFLKGVRRQLEEEGFIEIHTPKIVATATEGGTALFKIKYFEKDAYLNQSPQLYKQIMMASGFDRVYEIAPAFRAEEHNTPRHLNEFTSIDIEMAFADEEDAMGVLERVIKKGIEYVNLECEKFLVPSIPFPRISYTECVEILKKKGITMEWGEDFSMEANRVIGDGFENFYFIKDWPTSIKPFYAMPYEDNEKISRSFDLMYKEKEVTSGAQRVHDHELLKKRLAEQNLDLKDFSFYIQAFEYGMPPHAGWGLGLERMIVVLANLDNIREATLFPRDRRRVVP